MRQDARPADDYLCYGATTKDLIMLKDDTRNTILSRLGVYANLPMAVDEVTNMTGADVSDFAYRITQGRDKGRLNANAVEKANLNSWNTIAVTTSNASLIDLLSTAKADPSAEINRILEYEVQPNRLFAEDVTTRYILVVRWKLRPGRRHLRPMAGSERRQDKAGP